MSPFEHGEVFVLDDGGEAGAATLSQLQAAAISQVPATSVSHMRCNSE